jgi:hypothetical protein
MKKINLLYLIGELLSLILITFITFILIIIFSVIVFISEILKTINKGLNCGFRRNIA